MKMRVRGMPDNLTIVMPEGGTVPGSVRFVEFDGDVAIYEYVPETELASGPEPERDVTTRFDRVAAKWVRDNVPDAGDVVVGSVQFDVDAAAYASGAWCEFQVSWDTVIRHIGGDGREYGRNVARKTYDISDCAWDYSATGLMRELTDMEDPGES